MAKVVFLGQMSCLAYWGVIDYKEVLVLPRDFAGFEFVAWYYLEKWWLGESLRSRKSWKTLVLPMFLKDGARKHRQNQCYP